MKKALIYARVSSKEQEREGYSIPAQLELFKQYAQKNNLEIVKEFLESESAKTSGRKLFNEMLLYAKDNNINTVVFEKVDRMTRNYYDLVLIYELMETTDLEVHLIKNNLVMNKNSKSQEKFQLDIQVVLAKNHINNLSEEVIKGMTQKAVQGIYPSTAPFGYYNDKNEKDIKVSRNEALVVESFYKWYASGEYSLEGLRKKAKEEGLLDVVSKYKSSASHIAKVLKSPFYYGNFIWKGILYEGKHEPIIDKGLWETVQQVFAGKVNNSNVGHNKSFLFSGLMKCKRCGCSITAEIKKGKYIYYHCTNGKKNCEKVYVSEKKIEEQVSYFLDLISFDDKLRDWIVEALKESNKGKKEFNDKKLTALKKEYTNLQTKIDFLYDDRLEGNVDIDFWQRKHNELKEKQLTINAQIDQLTVADDKYIKTGIQILELLNNVKDKYLKQDVASKRQMLRFLVSNFYLDGLKLDIVWNKPFDIVVENLVSQKWRPLVDVFRTSFNSINSDILRAVI